MISAINSFDMSPIQGGMQAGIQRGAVNSPFTPLGQALKSTLDKYQAHQAAQQAQANAMALQQSKNENDIAVAKIGAGYAPDGTPSAPEMPPEVVWTKGPNGEDMYSTKKQVKGRIQQSDFTFAPKPTSMEQQLKDKALGPIVQNWGKGPQPAENPLPVPVAVPQAPTAQPVARIKVRDAKGNIGSIPATQLDEAMKQGYQRI